MLLPDCLFTVVDELPEIVDLEYAYVSTTFKHNSLLNRSMISVAMPAHSLVGTRHADEVQNSLPRFHFEVPNHPLKLLIYAAEDKEFASLRGMDAWDEEPISRGTLADNVEIIGTI